MCCTFGFFLLMIIQQTLRNYISFFKAYQIYYNIYQKLKSFSFIQFDSQNFLVIKIIKYPYKIYQQTLFFINFFLKYKFMAPADVHDASYYFKCMLGGMFGCGLTHTAIVPLDVAKCKRQVDKQFASSLGEGLKKLSKAGGLTLGWGPTLIGYSLQGLGKFGFYEIFKDVYKNIVGVENADKYKKIGWSVASGSAQIIADILLCPWEAVKLKIQLSRAGSEYPSSLGSAFAKLRAEEGVNGFYKGLVPLWSRQVPYTIVKFVAFEWFVQFFYDNIFTKGKQNYSKPTQLSVTFASGYAAGIFCAIISHPADTMVSKLYSQGQESGSTGEKVAKIYKEIGFRGLWAGLGTRILMIGTLTGLQWWIYDSFKTAVGLQTTGGGSSKPAPKA